MRDEGLEARRGRVKGVHPLRCHPTRRGAGGRPDLRDLGEKQREELMGRGVRKGVGFESDGVEMAGETEARWF